MMCFKDRTFCASPGCTNECGRKMSEDEKKELEKMNEFEWTAVSQAYFCGVPEEQLCDTALAVQFTVTEHE